MKRFFPLIIVLVALIVLLFPLVSNGFFVSDDGDWMIIRLSAFYQSLAEGQFPVRFLGRLNDSYGYPVSNFLYPGYLYIGSVLHALGFSFVASVKMLLAGSITGAAFFLYLWLRKYFKLWPAAIGTVSFILLPYLGFDMYTRGSVGEVLAIFGMSMCLYSIAWSKRALFALAVGFLILAHNSLALLFTPVIIGYLLQEKKMMAFLTPGLLGLGMSAFFWVPALFERGLTVFDATPVADSRGYLLSGSTFYLVASALLIYGISLSGWLRHRLKLFFLCVTFIAIFMVSPASSMLWDASVFYRWFQFPFRFLALLAVSVPFLASSIIEFCPKRYRILVVILFLSVWGLDISRTLSSFRPVYFPEGYYLTNEGTTTVHDEYMPRWVATKEPMRAAERIVFYKGNGEITPKVYTGHAFRVTAEALEDSVLQINTIYYPGWGVAVDGKRVEVDYNNPSGLIRVPLTKGEHTIEVAFRETLTRLIIDCVSLLSIVLFVFFVLKKRI